MLFTVTSGNDRLPTAGAGKLDTLWTKLSHTILLIYYTILYNIIYYQLNPMLFEFLELVE